MNGLHHDTGACSILLDCFVIPLTFDRVQQVNPLMGKVFDPGNFKNTIRMDPQAQILWKRALPAFVERCRLSWNHSVDCSYKSPGATIPLTTDHGGMPICTCGEGKDAHLLPQEYQVLGKFATRMALFPLCAVPYVERLSTAQETFKVPSADDVPASVPVGANNIATSTSSAVPVNKSICANCGSTKADLKGCQRCGKVKYCNHACQKVDWKTHKKVCGK